MTQTRNSRTTTNLNVKWMPRIVFRVFVGLLDARASSIELLFYYNYYFYYFYFFFLWLTDPTSIFVTQSSLL